MTMPAHSHVLICAREMFLRTVAPIEFLTDRMRQRRAARERLFKERLLASVTKAVPGSRIVKMGRA